MTIGESILVSQPEVAAQIRSAFPRLLASEVDRVLTILPVNQQQPTKDNIGPLRIAGEK